jgi:hypothetical protein
VNATQYMTRHDGMDYLQEIAFLDDSGVESLIKRVNRPGGTTTVVTGSYAVTNTNMGFTVSIRDEANLKMCVFYPNHQMRVTHTPTISTLWEQFIDDYPNITTVGSDTLPPQSDLLNRGYVMGLVGQVPFHMGSNAMNI